MVTLLDGHAAVSRSMAEQWDQQHLGREVQVNRSSLQAKPLAGRTTTGLPGWAMREMRWCISPVTARNMSEFLLGDVNLSMRKISEAAGMVGVAMRQHDMLDPLGGKLSSFDATDSCVRFVKLKAGHVDEWLPESLDGVQDIQQADSGVDKSQAVAVL